MVQPTQTEAHSIFECWIKFSRLLARRTQTSADCVPRQKRKTRHKKTRAASVIDETLSLISMQANPSRDVTRVVTSLACPASPWHGSRSKWVGRSILGKLRRCFDRREFQETKYRQIRGFIALTQKYR